MGSGSAASLAGGVSRGADIADAVKDGRQHACCGARLWKISPDACAATVVSAVKSRYRHFDCATDYGGEEQVGQGIKQAIDMGSAAQGSLHRDKAVEHVSPP